MVVTALMIALTTVVTMLSFPVPFTNGYIHLGDSMVFLGVAILGWRYGAVSAAVGSALADAFLGYMHWVPFTFCIKGGMALIMGLILAHGKTFRGALVSVVAIGGAWVAFNLAVRRFTAHIAASQSQTLLGEAGEDAGLASEADLATYVNAVEGRLMIAALAIPVMLVVIVFALKRSGKFGITATQLIAMSGAGVFMVFAYYLAGGLLMGGNGVAFAISAFSVPFNVVQYLAGFVLAAVMTAGLARTPLKMSIK
jgi:uncharacterized membrane protein